MASFSYQLGPTGNRTSLQEVMPGATASRASAWGYDKLFRLTNELAAGSSPTGSLGYIYDDVGNRLTRTNITSGLGLTNQTFTYNTNDCRCCHGSHTTVRRVNITVCEDNSGFEVEISTVRATY